MKLVTRLSVVSTLVGSVAMAAMPIGEISYEQFVESCKDPSAYGYQRAPEKIRVVCNDQHTSWQPAEAAELALPENRSVKAELFSDKNHVNAQDYAVAMPQTMAQYPKFKEVTRTVSIEKSLTCEQALSGVQQNLKDICVSALDAASAENPSLFTNTDTGRILDTSTGLIVDKQLPNSGQASGTPSPSSSTQPEQPAADEASTPSENASSAVVE